MRAPSIIAAMALTLSLAACGDDASPEQACKDFFSASCNKIESCSELFMVLGYGSVATCTQRLSLLCEPLLSAAGTTLSAGDFESCAAATRAQSCADAIAGVQPEACKVTGTLEDGKACGSDPQCQSGYCRMSGACGVCAKQAAAGESCTMDEDCAGGLACRQQVCVQYAEVGESCGGNAPPCRSTLICNNGTCAKPLGAGESCQPLGSLCDSTQGLLCSPQSRVCEKIALAGDGEPCGLVSGSLVGCKSSGKCKTDASGTGTCLAAAADGASCSTSDGPNCLPPASCEDGVCKLGDPSACQ
jgi:hypothetical protein